MRNLTTIHFHVAFHDVPRICFSKLSEPHPPNLSFNAQGQRSTPHTLSSFVIVAFLAIQTFGALKTKFNMDLIGVFDDWL